MKLNWRLGLGLLISVAGLYAVGRNIDLNQMSSALVQAKGSWLLLAILQVPVGLAFKSYHWQWLFRPALRPPLNRLYGAFSISYLVTSILPARMGELVRPLLLRQWLQIPMARTLSTILAERLLDICILFAFLLTLREAMPLPPIVAAGQTVLSIGAPLALIVLVLLSRNPNLALGLFDRLANALDTRLRAIRRFVLVARNILAELLQGVSALGRPSTAIPALAASVIAWLLLVLGTYWNLQAFNLSLPWTAPFLIVVATALGAVIPAPPAGLGVFEFLVVLVLEFYGVPNSVALSFALVYHLVNYGTLTLLGLMALWFSNLTLKGVTATVVPPDPPVDRNYAVEQHVS